MVNKSAPLRKKFIRGNQVLFMNRDIQKKLILEASSKITFGKNYLLNIRLVTKKVKKCVKIRKKLIKAYLNKLSQSSIEINKGL